MKLNHLLTLCAVMAMRISSTGQQAVFQTFNDYHFVAGDQIIFEDHFLNDSLGGFPARWHFLSGKGEINHFQNKTAILITDGHYAKVIPIIPDGKFLTDTFTIEFDFNTMKEAYPPMLFFPNKNGSERMIIWGPEVQTGYFTNQLSGTYPDGAKDFNSHWHHAAIAYTHGQLTCYLDQFLVLEIPDFGFVPAQVLFGGLGQQEAPLVFANVRIATGDGKEVLAKIQKDGKWITHGITFEDGYVTIKPESMGTLHAIVKVLTEKPDIKVEIGVFTANNENGSLKLSDDRASAVKSQIVSMGIKSSRLCTKGYGEKYPLVSNASSEGKAINKRVEFKLVK